VTSKAFIGTFITAKSRFQREPDLLDGFLFDSDDIASFLQDPLIQKTFHAMTIDYIMLERTFNWLNTDSAISILDRVADYLHYGINIFVHKNTIFI
jgi:hypothetical protein